VAAATLIIIIGIFLILNENAFKFSYKPVKHENKLFESFLMGVLTSLAWSPCYGAYLIAVIAYSASTGDFIYSAINMMLYVVGFSLTIFIIAFLASRINITGLIKYSKWIRLISGVIILVAGIYMLSGMLGIF
jgi:cytochrome c-type biogenesis protein